MQLPPPPTAEIDLAFQQIEPQFIAMELAVTAVLSDPQRSSAAISDMLGSERLYLESMDRIVRLYENEAQTRVRYLRRAGALGTAAVLGMMAALYWLLVRPATSLIRVQVASLVASERRLHAAHNDLERRVAERTRDLSAANAALAAEALERADAERRTFQLQNQLAHASRVTSLGQLASGIAHEVNQPLGAITNYAETLLLQTASEPLDRTALRVTSGRLRDAALRAGQIIRRMRNFVRLQPEARSAELLNPLVEEVLAICEPEIRGHAVQVRTVLDATSDDVVLVDPIQIQQVLVNLIHNAVQALEGLPEERRTLRISTVGRPEGVVIQVEDTGAGFPGGAPHSFAPLLSSKPQGLGLGLSISHTLIAAHGGELVAENLEPCGARVSCFLPAMKVPGHYEHADSLCCR
jgi:C4-dicarboxylate-specific signal transduction histidine kinase